MVQPVSSFVTNSEDDLQSVSSGNNDTPVIGANLVQDMDNSFISLLTEPDEEDVDDLNTSENQSLFLENTEESSLLDLNNMSVTEPPRCRNMFNDGSRQSVTIDNESSSVMSEASGDWIFYPTGIRSEIVDNGIFLFQGFVRNEFHRRNLPEPSHFDHSFLPFSVDERLSADISDASDRLRELSNRFLNSPLRKKVSEQAQKVSLHLLDFNSFSDILFGLFQEGGVTWERVIVLFFFCSDVLVRAVQEKLMGQFTNIVHWSVKFFSCHVFTSWIQDNGGWDAVIQESLNNVYKMAAIGFCTVGIIVLAVYLLRKR